MHLSFSLFKILLIGLLISVTIPLLLSPKSMNTAVNLFKRKISLLSKNPSSSLQSPRAITSTSLNNATATMPGRTPVYFLSHGGPNIMEETSHAAYAKLQEIGLAITQKVKPKAIVVFSAHWEGYRDTIEVNTAENMGLIYDFYGFPPHYYEYQYPHTGSPELAEKVIEKIRNAGIKVEGVRRGLDHGVWAGFMCAFSPEKNPLNVPIVQVSIFDIHDPDMHYNLGRAISSLRDEGVQIITSGMAVHNLRDMGRMWGKPGALDYAVSFDAALKEAVEVAPEKRQQAMKELLKRPDAKKAHPSFDHLLPIYIGAGAASDEVGKQLWTLPEGSMSWAQFRFGDVAA